MDNSNNPNQTNNPDPLNGQTSNPWGTPPPEPVQSAPLNANPVDPSSLWNQTPAPSMDPLAATPAPDPTSSNPWSSIPTTPEPTAAPAPAPEPTSYQPAPAPVQPEPAQPSSPLDNPWGSPSQPPAFDGGIPTAAPQSQSQYQAPEPQIQSQPQSQPMAPQPEPTSQTPSWVPPAPGIESSAPTDLSHLISSNPQPEQAQSAPSETLVVPPAAPIADTPSLPTENHKSIPKWLIGVGVGLLIVVIGASAYFILGIGQPAKPASLPATETETNVVVPPPTPLVTPAPAVEETTGSTNFGQLEGSTTPQASSAADLIRQRQQQGQ